MIDGLAIVRFRREHGLKRQSDLAALLGVHPNTVLRWERDGSMKSIPPAMLMLALIKGIISLDVLARLRAELTGIAIPIPIAPTERRGATMKIPAHKVRPDDLIDLEGDLYADPRGEHPEFEFELLLVNSVEEETADCIAIGFEGFDVVGFPRDHMLTVTRSATFRRRKED